MNILPSTQSLRCKRFPDGMIMRLKASMYARGDIYLEGVDFFETFAQVGSWQTVIIMRILSLSIV
jgi:hypothetical protein